MTKPKLKEKAEARRLRQEGVSVRTIAQMLGVSRGSVSTWVRDIELTPEQRKALKGNQKNNQVLAARANVEKHLQLREQYQQEGREKAREGDLLHLAGCMLYWGEGAKARNSLTMTNSDADMLIFYMRFLKESLGVVDDDITLHINCYTHQGLTLEEIETYWVETLDLPASCLRKSSINIQPSSSQQKGRKLLYGTCKIHISQTRLIQHVYGAIQEYSGIDKPEWVL